ncbi:MAG: alpha/beta fold hydrolase [Acidobacteriota bacterium]
MAFALLFTQPGADVVYRIERSAGTGVVVFVLGGEMDSEHAARLRDLITVDAECRVLVDLLDVTFVDRAAMRFLARVEAQGVRLVNCPEYVRRWIAAENASHQENPMPDPSVNMTEDRFTSTDGLNIVFRSWRPQGQPRGLVAIVPGFNSHSGYYTWVAEQFVAAGYAASAIDLRGRGKSDGERFYVAKFADYVADVTAFVHLMKSRQPGVPIFLLGHSAGGVVSCLYATEHQTELAGLICESFAFRLPAPSFALAVLKGLSHVAPHAHVLRLKNEDFSRDPHAVEAMNADPLIAHETQPTNTLAEMVRADERLGQEFPRMTLPLLILHGTADKASQASGSQFFYETAGSKDKTLKLYEGHFHDLLNDVGREKVMADITGWIDAVLTRA